jgi:hypothetical protein
VFDAQQSIYHIQNLHAFCIHNAFRFFFAYFLRYRRACFQSPLSLALADLSHPKLYWLGGTIPWLEMKYKFFIPVLSLVLLTACGNSPAITPTVTAIPTPDVYKLALGNIQAQATLDAMQATSQAISANLTATAYAPTYEAAATATERSWMQTAIPTRWWTYLGKSRKSRRSLRPNCKFQRLPETR